MLHLQISRPTSAKTWWLVGIYQHVAKPTNVTRRQNLLRCLADIKQRADQAGHCLLILGDANAAPAGGRWRCPPHSRLHESDLHVTQWAAAAGLTEHPQPRLEPTWRASLRSCSATLDRVWSNQAATGTSTVYTRWAASAAQFDHALVFVDLPRASGGIGFAGACCDLRPDLGTPRCKVDVDLLGKKRDEYSSSVQKILLDLRTEQSFDNPFDALREAVQRADQVAQSMAPRRCRTVGTIRQRPYMFSGHKQLAREVTWLAEARKTVYAILKRDTAMTWWPERRILWSQHVAQLPRRLRRTRHKQPPELRIPFARLLETETIPTLENWLV